MLSASWFEYQSSKNCSVVLLGALATIDFKFYRRYRCSNSDRAVRKRSLSKLRCFTNICIEYNFLGVERV